MLPTSRHWGVAPDPSPSFRKGAEQYLAYVEQSSGSDRPPSTDAGRDRAWLTAHGDEGSEFVLVTALGTLEAAHQHLRGLAVLSEAGDVDVALQALTRPCLEASATIMWILDPDVDEATRVERALNLLWARQPRMRQVVRDKAAQYKIPLQLSRGRNPRVLGVGAGALRGAELLERVVGQLLPPDTIALFWRCWSSSSHGDFTAGFQTMVRPRNGDGWGFRQAALSLAALGHFSAFKRYQGYAGSLFEDELLAAFSALALSVLTMEHRDPP